jgi:hypothetical protein
VVRAGGFWKDRLRGYKILVDGQSVGCVYTLTVPRLTRTRSVQAKIDVFKSREVVLSVEGDETTHLVSSRCPSWRAAQDRWVHPAVGRSTDRSCRTCHRANLLTHRASNLALRQRQQSSPRSRSNRRSAPFARLRSRDSKDAITPLRPGVGGHPRGDNEARILGHPDRHHGLRGPN